MRILSIIALCFIVAASAYGGERKDHRDSNDRPAAAQSSAREHSSAPSEVRTTPSATPPAGPARGVEQPRSYQGGIGYAPRTHETPSHSFTPLYGSGRNDAQTDRASGFNRPAPTRPDVTPQRPVGLGYRPGNPTDTTSHGSAGSSRPDPYFLHRQETNDQRPQPARPADVAQAPIARTNPVGPIAYEPLRDRGNSHSKGNERDNGNRGDSRDPGRNSSYSPRQDDRSHGPAPRDSNRPSSHYQPGSPSHGGPSHDAPKVYATGYAPHGTTYTIGYHRPTKIVVPKTYIAPNFRQGRYYYPATYRVSRPCYFGYWAYDYDPSFCWRSVYFSFGMFPYVQVSRIRECTYVSVAYVSDPLFIHGRYYLHDNRFIGLDDALGDIRSAWISGRYDLIERHVRNDSSLSVLTDGKYDYAISSRDYLDMTHDAISDLDTVSFVWDQVRERRDGTVTAFGEHSYRSGDGVKRVYVSYTMEKYAHDYIITEVGSSLYPLD